jgi:hypothetical protein
MEGVEDHDVQAVEKEMRDKASVLLQRLVAAAGLAIAREHHGLVPLEHSSSEGLDLDEDVGEVYTAGLKLATIGPDVAHHLVDLEADERGQYRCPLLRGLWRDAQDGDGLVFDVQGELGVVILTANHGAGALGLAGADVQEA